MATNLGIDFGSTYTMLSYFDDVKKKVKGIQTENGSIYIPSVACVDEFGDLLTGDDARNEMRSNLSLKPFRAFKMLLHESDEKKVRGYGYTDHKPKEISKVFLEKCLKVALEECGVEQFDRAVITVPELWVGSFEKMGGREVLLKICEELKLFRNIRVVTEPVAASAYYAHNYQDKHNGEPFQGRIAVVDYGGGTLDITLTRVTAKPGNTMEIEVEWSDGAGENHPNQIGDAGLAYMEKVTALALSKAGFENVPMDGNFLRVKDKLESALMTRTGDLRNLIAQKYQFGLKGMGNDHQEFTYAAYKGKKISITYAMLYEVFDKHIYPVLETYLSKLKAAAVGKDKNIDSAEDLKIAIVGGFGQFPLVQKAIWSYFKCSNTVLDITLDAEGGKQDAISFGAALIAANEVYVKPTSKYSIGSRSYKGGRETFDYAITIGQDVDPTKVYMVGAKKDPKTPEDEEGYAISYDGSTDPKFLPWIFATNNAKKPMRFNDGKMREFAYRMTPRKEILDKFQVLPEASYYFGFSMDESGIYTVHTYKADINTGRLTKEEAMEPVRLGNFIEIFGNAAFNPNDEKNLLYKYEEDE